MGRQAVIRTHAHRKCPCTTMVHDMVTVTVIASGPLDITQRATKPRVKAGV